MAQLAFTTRRLLCAVGCVAALLLSACEPLGPDELQREVETIGSVSAEGSVLADQVARQSTKRTFARVQSRELADAAEHSAERLTDAHPADGLGEPTQRAIDLAGRISDEIGELEQAPDDATQAAGIATRLRDLSDRADSLAGSL